MFSKRELSLHFRTTQQLAKELDDSFIIETRKMSVEIETIDGDSIVLAGHRYVILVKNLSDKEYQLSIAAIEPKPDSNSIHPSGKTIVVKKGQYIELKQTSQYQESEKQQEERHNQLTTVRFKNWAKDIWETKRIDIIINLSIAIIFFFLGIFAC